MEGIIIEILIIYLIFMAIMVTMDLKLKNFVPEKYSNILIIAMYVVIFTVRWAGTGFSPKAYESLSLLIVPAALIVTYTFVIKSKFYCFKGIDKKFVRKNRDEISKIIQEYKLHNLQGKSDISLGSNNIIFERVSASQIKECLSMIGDYLDDNRDKYSAKDYVVYYTKVFIVPSTILAFLMFAAFKIG
ncbi:hypothetical protein [Sedimentibacter saalensis]|uniref:Uncharacterized protein n=1 Tax=Sedimentibacter saalensis TaxID=130788 RepID=A0A562JKJ2_9FIRM|nr:hypothetical protein [Sedimentibacter saalensis]TWH83767.1 hypothetical protein LY60_00379 [Sedimentibacter saalensis]